MPFIRLVEDRHKCYVPKTREDETPLKLGDIWECGELINPGGEIRCTRRYRWAYDQREGSFWIEIFQT